MRDPASGECQLLGDVISSLKRLSIYRPGENQMKIHSKVAQADDGWLYFASTDEQGEKEDGSQYPDLGKPSLASSSGRRAVGTPVTNEGVSHSMCSHRTLCLRTRCVWTCPLSVGYE